MKEQSPSKKLCAGIWFILVVLHFSILGTSMLSLGAFQMPIIFTMMLIQTVLVMLLCHGDQTTDGKLIRLFVHGRIFGSLIQFIFDQTDISNARCFGIK